MIPLHSENPTRHFSFVTISLLLLNSFFFFYELPSGRAGWLSIEHFAVVPYNFVHYRDSRQIFTLLSSLFLHGSFLHLAGNMLYLWIFGNNIEDVLGHSKFLFFYLLCGIFASLAHIFANPGSILPTIGASGAISGVLGAYLILFPRAKILTLVPFLFFIRLVKLPAFFFLGLWILLQLFFSMNASGMNHSQGGGTAWLSHIGGFFAGIFLLPVFYRRKQRYN